jgi:hypothetical protein
LSERAFYAGVELSGSQKCEAVKGSARSLVQYKHVECRYELALKKKRKREQNQRRRKEARAMERQVELKT